MWLQNTVNSISRAGLRSPYGAAVASDTFYQAAPAESSQRSSQYPFTRVSAFFISSFSRISKFCGQLPPPPQKKKAVTQNGTNVQPWRETSRQLAGLLVPK